MGLFAMSDQAVFGQDFGLIEIAGIQPSTPFMAGCDVYNLDIGQTRRFTLLGRFTGSLIQLIHPLLILSSVASSPWLLD